MQWKKVLRIPEDARLSAFISSKDLFQVGGEAWSMQVLKEKHGGTGECLEWRCSSQPKFSEGITKECRVLQLLTSWDLFHYGQ